MYPSLHIQSYPLQIANHYFLVLFISGLLLVSAIPTYTLLHTKLLLPSTGKNHKQDPVNLVALLRRQALIFRTETFKRHVVWM